MNVFSITVIAGDESHRLLKIVQMNWVLNSLVFQHAMGKRG